MLKKNKQINLNKVFFIGFILFSVFLFCAVNKNLIYKRLALPIASYQKWEKDAVLSSIEIPVLNINANIENVGLTSDGAMGVPVGPSEVSWFSLGPRPGEIGSAVLSGHSGWKNGIPAVFDNLYKLNKGDKIYIKNDKGITTTFIVTESKKYAPDADAIDVFSSSDGKAHLNLITCTGIWDNIKKSRSERLVVFADKE